MGNDLELTPDQEAQVEELVAKNKKVKLLKMARKAGGFDDDKVAEEATKKDLAIFIVLSKPVEETSTDPGVDEADESPKPADPTPEPQASSDNYLEPYEVKDKTMDDSAMKTRADLLAMPKVQVHMPLTPGEPKGIVQPFSINGYRLRIPKGKSVFVPEEIAKMIANRYDFELGTGNNPLDAQFQANASAKELA